MIRPAEPGRRGDPTPWVVLGTVLVVAGLAALYFIDPARTSFYPGCPVHRLTGMLCPGCGGLRATHHLLHGHWTEAFRLNPAWVISLPFFVGFGGLSVWRKLRGQPAPTIATGWIVAGAIGALAFGVARNLKLW